MKVMIIGGGGREHALAWKVARSRKVTQVYVAPGNGGTAWAASDGVAPSQNIDIDVTNMRAQAQFAREQGVELTIVGPEVPLADGIVDYFKREGVRIFGPSQAAARLESSKAFSKAFMAEFHIPTAEHATFTDYNEAMAYLATDYADGQVVVKASGLAAGKGVIVCDTLGEAQQAVQLMLRDNRFGSASTEVIIEERLTGPELSLLAMSDGRTVKPLVTARDHKRIFDQDEGPNTGGMGAFAPVPDVDAPLIQEVVDRVLQPTIDGMAQIGTPYIGVLYAGLMLTPNGIKTLEFNCRFGDPETQVVLPLLKTDLIDMIEACLLGSLDELEIEHVDQSCATIVMASPGYPASYPKGLLIDGVGDADRLDGVTVFHAGTKRADYGQLVTNGGRVLAVSAVGRDLDDALAKGYAGIERISFENAHYRTDIGKTD